MPVRNNKGDKGDSGRGNSHGSHYNTCCDDSYSLARSYFDYDQYLPYFHRDFRSLYFGLLQGYFLRVFHLAKSCQALSLGDSHLRWGLKVAVAKTR